MITAGLAVKYRWHERFFAPSVHAVCAAGGHVEVWHRGPDWVREFLGPDFLAEATSLSLNNPSLSDAEISRLVQRFPHLEDLDLSNTQFGDDVRHIIGGSTRFAESGSLPDQRHGQLRSAI